MDKYYLTDTIYLKDSQLYYEENNKNKKITKKNWHIILNEYGWEKLDIRWIKKLNKFSKVPLRNSLFGVLDCGGEGDCLFHCISYALKSLDLLNEKYDVNNLRKFVCDNIDYQKYEEIIGIYKILKDSDDFDEDWDPYDTDFYEFQRLLLDGGNNYWGDNIIINILKEKLNINIIILNSNSITKQYNYYPIMYEFDKDLKTIILSYEDQIHFRLIGYYNNHMITCFDKTNIPFEILELIKNMR